MINVIIHGISGKMGRALDKAVTETENIKISAGIDKVPIDAPFPVFTDASQCNAEADVIIDFSAASAVPAIVKYAEERKLPLVLCTTGLSDDTLKMVEDASKKIPLLRSANMSLGVNLLMDLVKQAAEVLFYSDFDIEIVEKHHNQKADAPSGTALAIADGINEALGNKLEYIFDRSAVRKARDKKELGIHAVRGGTIPGDHDVIFAGKNEILEISHKALSRDIFAVGAVKAALFLAGKSAGMYSMKDVIRDSK